MAETPESVSGWGVDEAADLEVTTAVYWALVSDDFEPLEALPVDRLGDAVDLAEKWAIAERERRWYALGKEVPGVTQEQTVRALELIGKRLERLRAMAADRMER